MLNDYRDLDRAGQVLFNDHVRQYRPEEWRHRLHETPIDFDLGERPSLGSLHRRRPGPNLLLEKLETSSHWILDLEPDFDEAGSATYRPETLARALRFLQRSFHSILAERRVEMTLPEVLPGPKGSIDLHWKASDSELLINVPEDVNAPATFYGDDYGQLRIKGSFDPDTYNLGLLEWLAKQSA